MTDANPTVLYGLYSEKQAELAGTSFYSTPEGGEVELTDASADKEFPNNKWDDRILLGKIGRWLRRGREGSSPIGWRIMR